LEQVAALEQVGQFGRGDLEFQVLLMAGFNLLDDVGHLQIVAGAQSFEGFIGIEGATGTPANVKMAEQGALRAWKNFQNALHRAFRLNEIGHAPKNFWISTSTS